jgi:flagellar basal-body rod modification protein FlgD
MTTHPVTAAAAAASPDISTDSGSKSGLSTDTAGLANQDTFLQLLVAQIKNQDPLNPTDGVQCLTQLAQFSSLEQQLQMNTQLADIKDEIANLQNGTTTP